MYESFGEFIVYFVFRSVNVMHYTRLISNKNNNI